MTDHSATKLVRREIEDDIDNLAARLRILVRASGFRWMLLDAHTGSMTFTLPEGKLPEIRSESA